MTPASLEPVWRVASLRGLSRSGADTEALVALCAGQYLRIRVDAARLEPLRARVGQRVWVDLDAWSVRADEPPRVRHA